MPLMAESADHQNVKVVFAESENIKRSDKSHSQKPVRILQRKKSTADHSAGSGVDSTSDPHPQPHHEQRSGQQHPLKNMNSNSHRHTKKSERKSSRKMTNYNLVKDRIFREERASFATRTPRATSATNSKQAHRHGVAMNSKPIKRNFRATLHPPRNLHEQAGPSVPHAQSRGAKVSKPNRSSERTNLKHGPPPAPAPAHTESLNVGDSTKNTSKASKDFDVCWEFNTAKGCHRGASCKWKHEALLKDAVHPWTGDKLYGEFCAHRHWQSPTNSRSSPAPPPPLKPPMQHHEQVVPPATIHLQQFRARHRFDQPFTECEIVTQTAAVFRAPLGPRPAPQVQSLTQQLPTQLPLPPTTPMPGVYMHSHDICNAPVMTPIKLSYCVRCGCKCGVCDNFCGQCGLNII